MLSVALDFINTLEHTSSGDADALGSPTDATGWLHGRDLLSDDAVVSLDRRIAADARAATRAMTQVRRGRAAMRELVDATVARRVPEDRHVKEVNRMLGRPARLTLVRSSDGMSLLERPDGGSLRAALAPLAEVVARTVTGPDAERLRVCANDDCRWVFQDTSRAGHRKWCSMSACGNRAKASRHRQRVRDAVKP